jgi:hypothetical protein
MIFGNIFLKACNVIFMSIRYWIFFVEVYLFDWKYMQCVDFHAYKGLRIIRILDGYYFCKLTIDLIK